MNPSSSFLAIGVACCLLRPESLVAQDAAPFVFAKQYSADVVTTDKKGDALESKMYVDSGKLRTEANTNGTSRQILIIRPDQHKFYQVMVDRKMVMETPMDSERYKKAIGPFGPKNKFEWIGPETVDGVTCTKYEGTYPGIYGHAKGRLPVGRCSEASSDKNVGGERHYHLEKFQGRAAKCRAIRV